MFLVFASLLLECVALYHLYPVMDRLANQMSLTYRTIHPPHKKKYVLANLIKGGVLGLFSPAVFLFLYNHLLYGSYDRTWLYILGSVFTCLDLVSIFRVPKLPSTTLFHHIAVGFLFLYTVQNDMAFNSYSRLIVVYGKFSCLAFVVNLFLGMRVLKPPKNFFYMRVFAFFAFVNYLLCCIMNWSYQFYYVVIDRSIFYASGWASLVIYSLLIFTISRDDIILMKYLLRTSQSTRNEISL
jgi:hypothetical protein